MDEGPRLRRIRRKLPRKAVTPLMEFCEVCVMGSEKSAIDMFRGLLENMRRYQEYLFDRPWPRRFEYEEVT